MEKLRHRPWKRLDQSNYGGYRKISIYQRWLFFGLSDWINDGATNEIENPGKRPVSK